MAAYSIAAAALPAKPCGAASVVVRLGAAQEDAERMKESGRDSEERGRAAVAPSDDPDIPLLRRAGRGDQQACRLLMDRHLGRVLGLARRMLGSAHDAEDVAQEAFLRVWRHAAAWEPGRARFETWLYRVTLNLCYDKLRRRREMTTDDLPEMIDPAPSVIAMHESRDLAQAVEGALASLPERQRAALVLCHFQELSNAEAAAMLNVTVEALESLLSRGRRALRGLLAEQARLYLETG